VKRRELMQTMAAGLAAGASWPLMAQQAERPAGYPTRPLRIVVPFPPGGPADALARPLGKVLGDMTGQPVIIENRPGANTVIGASNVLAAPADGYSMLLANEAGLSLGPAVAPYVKVEVPYDAAKDFVGISLLAQYGSLMTVHPAVPARTLQEFIEYAKKNPGKINYASFGSGSQPQMSMELLARQTGINIVHVPYKGVAPAVLDLMAGRVQAMISAPATPLPYVHDGRLRALAYSGTRRLSLLPDVPTFAEAQLPGYSARGWFGIVMHSATPAPIRAWLADTIWSIVKSSEYQKNAIVRNGLEVPAVDPSQVSAFLAEDRASWRSMANEVKDRLS
jgi:tripartite-type tricarboxylate transporter receptor subunit TctC